MYLYVYIYVYLYIYIELLMGFQHLSIQDVAAPPLAELCAALEPRPTPGFENPPLRG